MADTTQPQSNAGSTNDNREEHSNANRDQISPSNNPAGARGMPNYSSRSVNTLAPPSHTESPSALPGSRAGRTPHPLPPRLPNRADVSPKRSYTNVPTRAGDADPHPLPPRPEKRMDVPERERLETAEPFRRSRRKKGMAPEDGGREVEDVPVPRVSPKRKREYGVLPNARDNKFALYDKLNGRSESGMDFESEDEDADDDDDDDAGES